MPTAQFTDSLVTALADVDPHILSPVVPKPTYSPPIVIAVGADELYGSKVLTYLGKINPDASISWKYQSMTGTITREDNYLTRLVHTGAIDASILYSSDKLLIPNYSFLAQSAVSATMGTLNSSSAATYLDTADMHTNGVVVIHTVRQRSFIPPYALTGCQLKVSADYGVTWTDSINVDYLTTLLGANYNTNYRSTVESVHVKVDEATGIFYLLTRYTLSGVNYYVLLSSADGLTWAEVETWTETGKYGSSLCSLGVRDGRICVVFMNTTFNGYYINYSPDAGASWTETTLNTGNIYNYFTVVCSSSAIILAVVNLATDRTTLRKSTDGGATWVDVLNVYDADTARTYTFRSSHNLYVYTNMGIEYPSTDPTGYWVDSTGTHSLAGSGEDPYKCFWYSVDDGATWVLTTVPLPGRRSTDPDNTTDRYWGLGMDIFATADFTVPVIPYSHTLVYVKDVVTDRKGWFYDTYTPGITTHYGEEGAKVHSILCGGVDGGVYQLTGNSDAGNAVLCQVSTGCLDQGDPRYNKLYGDVMVDCDTSGVDITATPRFNNDSSLGAATVINTAIRTQVPVPVGTSWVVAKNISIDLSWSMSDTRSYLYIWEPRYTEESGKVFAYSWETSYLTHGLPGYYYHGYLYLIHISTADLTFTITGEGGVVMASVTIPNSAGLYNKSLVRLPVVKGKWFRYSLSSSAEFRVEGQESELLIKPWGMGSSWKRERIFQDSPQGEAA